MIYLDNAATTRTSREVLEAMLPYFVENFANPSAIYRQSGEVKKGVANARREVASLIGANEREIFFTSGGTEADNWALKACVDAREEKGGHVITTKIEHHAILHACEYLEKRGVDVTYLCVDETGLISPEQVEKAIRPDTFLISVMTANNEVGTIQPIAEIGKIARAREIFFHTDAVQAFGQIPLSVDELCVDMLSASAHKLGGPKGTGCLYVRSGIKLEPFMHGGAQERSRRAGTENVPGIVGFGAAAIHARLKLMEKQKREEALRDHMILRILTEIPKSSLNGHRTARLPGNVNITFEGVDAQSLLIRLDEQGICASAGSACTTGSPDPSHVLTAMGLETDAARSTVRFTIGEDNTREEIDRAVDAVRSEVEQLRGRKRILSYS